MKLHQSGIYTITAPSGKQYVGSAARFSTRWRLHRRHLIDGDHHNKPLLNAYKKYGPDKIIFAILLVCRKEDLLMFEQRAIDALNPQYNMCRTAGSPQGVKRSKETLAKISAASKGRVHSEASRATMSASWVGRIFSEEHRAKISAARKGHVVTEETRAKLRVALTGRKHTEEAKAKITAAQTGRPGRPHTEKTKAKLREARKLQITSEETRKKMSDSQRAAWARRLNQEASCSVTCGPSNLTSNFASSESVS